MFTTRTHQENCSLYRFKNSKHRRSCRDRYPRSKLDKTNSFQITTIDCTRASRCIFSRYHGYQGNKYNDLKHARLAVDSMITERLAQLIKYCLFIASIVHSATNPWPCFHPGRPCRTSGKRSAYSQSMSRILLCPPTPHTPNYRQHNPRLVKGGDLGPKQFLLLSNPLPYSEIF